MRNELTEIKRAISTICAKQHRGWSSQGHSNRTDAPTGRKLSSDTVDAAFADEAINFAPPTSKGPMRREDQAEVVAGLSAQLAQLESQCSHLRRMLEIASQD